jgi:hypothetical protein
MTLALGTLGNIKQIGGEIAKARANSKMFVTVMLAILAFR